MFKKIFGGGDKSLIPPMEILNSDTEHSEKLLEHHTDVDFIRNFFEIVNKGSQATLPILETSFMERSAGAYSSHWVMRELIQNWVDVENLESGKKVGTLDGVNFQETLLDDGTTRFTISGAWKLSNLDGLVGLSSNKAEGFTAGGNGIGLKQTVLRLLRDDFNVSKFEILATSDKKDVPMIVSYKIVSPADIEAYYEKNKMSPVRNITKPWLVADIKPVSVDERNEYLLDGLKDKEDACAYIIETNDEGTIKKLREMKDLGVSSENEFLKDPDFESEKGSIKWLTQKEEGKIFINGQVMDYKDRTSEAKAFPGTEGLSIRLNNINYAMSIDRAPISFIDLQKYSDALFENCSTAELVNQLRKSTQLWTNNSDRPSVSVGYVVVLKSIISNLKKLNYSYEEFKKDFGDNFAVVDSYDFSQKDLAALKEKDYIPCLECLNVLGIPSYKGFIEDVSNMIGNRPNVSYFEIKNEQKFNSPEKAYFKRYKLDTEEDLADGFIRDIKGYTYSITNEGDITKLNFNYKCNEDDLRNDLSEVGDNLIDNIIHKCRGFIFNAINLDCVNEDSTYMIIAGKVVTFSITKDKKTLVAQIADKKTVISSKENVVELGFKLKTNKNLFGEQKNEGISQLEISKDKTDKSDKSRLLNSLGEAVSQISIDNSRDGEVALFSGEIERVSISLDNKSLEKVKEIHGLGQDVVSVVEKMESVLSDSDKQKTLNPRERLIAEWVLKRGLLLIYDGEGVELTVEDRKTLSLTEMVSEISKSAIDCVVPSVVDKNTLDAIQKINEVLNLGKRISSVAKEFIPDAEDLEDFEIIEPDQNQKDKVKKIKLFFHLMGYDIKNDIFIYKGKNVKGFNIAQKAIGINEAVLKPEVSFVETMALMTHEISHNRTMDHDLEFIRTEEALFSNLISKLLEILSKSAQGNLSDDDKQIVDLYKKWGNVKDTIDTI